jgi:hypothetical protein
MPAARSNGVSDDIVTIKLQKLGVFATPEEVAKIVSLQRAADAATAVPAAINAAAEAHGLPKTAKGYGISVETREFIGPQEE